MAMVNEKLSVLILGSKEYPMGTNKGDDPITSGGIETYVDDIAQELSRRCKLIIITRRFRGTKTREKIGDITVYRVPWVKGKYIRTPTFNFLAFFLSICLLIKRKGDIIYSHGPIASFFGYILAKTFKKPLVCRPAGVAFPQWPFPFSRMFYIIEKSVYYKCDKLIFHSEGERKILETKLSTKFKNSRVIMTGFPVEKFLVKEARLRDELKITKDAIIVTFVGRLAPVKGLEYLVRAVDMLKGEDLKVLLVGEGPEREKLEKLIERLDLKDKFLFIGFRRDIPRFLAITNIFVVSSTYEGLPTSLLEAMAARKACIVTDIGLPVEHMKNAIVVPPQNPEKLAEAIKSLIQDKDLRERLGENARKFAEENCTMESFVAKHLKVFNSVIC